MIAKTGTPSWRLLAACFRLFQNDNSLQPLDAAASSTGLFAFVQFFDQVDLLFRELIGKRVDSLAEVLKVVDEPMSDR